MQRTVIILGLIFSFKSQVLAQNCTLPGQTPVSAVFVCSSETFSITTPDYCGQTTVPVPCTDGAMYRDKNPNFFRFGCYAAGTLGFSIVPNDAFANYNWQLFDVTNTNPVDIYSNASLFVACNWSGEPGETGASIDGTMLTVCSGAAQPLYCKMPDLLTGRTYLLMVSNESASPAGYQLTFTGGSAVITDPSDPHLLVTELNCERNRILVRLNKQIKCNTLAADGTDFMITGGVNITGATPTDCSSQFGTPSLMLALDQPLPFGNYTLSLRNGTDGNTLVDICSKSIPAGENLTVISTPQEFTPMDSIYNVECKPGFIELVFKKPILCNSIAADGSDFRVTGPQPVTATPFITTCNNGSTSIIRLNLSGNIVTGNYQVTLLKGSDGNTLLNECLVSTPENSVVDFDVEASVSATFNHSNNTSCNQTKVSFFHNDPGSTSWNWNFGNGQSSSITNPVIDFQKGNYTVRLIVSNGICTDTSSQTIVINDRFDAEMELPSIVCPGDLIEVKDASSGNIDQWSWNLGTGQSSTLKNPLPFRLPDTNYDAFFTIRLIVSNSLLGCSDTITRSLKKLKSCLVDVPTAFTPNGDGKNDFLYPLNAVKAGQLEFRIYNRFGQLVFFTRDWTKKWDGKVNGVLQATGVYAWILSYTERDSGEKVFKRGMSLLLR